MLSNQDIKAQIPHALEATGFQGLGRLYQGKVRDVYRPVTDTGPAASGEGLPQGHMAIITTDRISAFDRVLGTVPFKGALLNAMAQYWFQRTTDICPNHLVSAPHPNLWLVRECEPIPVEMVVRGYLTGTSPTSAWTAYARGERNFCGNQLPDGLQQEQPFPEPIITPSTKAEQGAHDESVAPDELFSRGLVDRELYDRMAETSMRLYQRGVELAVRQGLIFVDTKYEFGLLDGQLTLMDEVNTPDSSRYWLADTYEERYQAGQSPQKMDKDHVRNWLSGQGFRGDGQPPTLTEEVKVEATRRYLSVYEMVVGEPFAGQSGPVSESLALTLREAGWL